MDDEQQTKRQKLSDISETKLSVVDTSKKQCNGGNPFNYMSQDEWHFFKILDDKYQHAKNNIVNLSKDDDISEKNYNDIFDDTFLRLCSRFPLSKSLQEYIVFIVDWYSADGYGDAMHAYKTAQILHIAFPHSELIIRVDDATREKAEKIFDETYYEYFTDNCLLDILYFHPTKKFYIFEVATPMIEKENAYIDMADKFKIEGEYIRLSKKLKKELNIVWKIDATHIIIDEYNGWRAQDYSDKCTSIVKVSGIGMIYNRPQQCVGVHITSSSESTSHLNYFFGYFAKDENRKNDDVLLFFLETIITTYDDENYISFEIVSAVKDIDWLAITNNLKEKRHVSIILPDNVCISAGRIGRDVKMVAIKVHTFLPPNEMHELMRGSRREVLVSGDQSWVEALSMYKLVVYQAQTWKFGLCSEMIKLEREIIGQGKALTLFYEAVYDILSRPNIEPNIEQLKTILRSDTIDEENKRFINFLKTHYSIRDWIVGKVVSDVLLKNNEVAQVYKEKGSMKRTYDILQKHSTILD